MPNQFANPSNILAHEKNTAEEICSIHCCTLKSEEGRKECLRTQGAARCCVLEPC